MESQWRPYFFGKIDIFICVRVIGDFASDSALGMVFLYRERAAASRPEIGQEWLGGIARNSVLRRQWASPPA